jgi:hypothetical protein
MEELTFDEFIEKYKPIDNPHVEDAPFDFMFETYDEEFEQVKNTEFKYVWTIVESDEGTVLIPGVHLVNRLGYFITEVPWENENIEVNLYDEEIEVESEWKSELP